MIHGANGNRRGRPAPRTRRGFSLIESVMCVVIVSVMFVAVMNTVGAARMAQYKTDGRTRGSLWAQELMAEIIQQAYEDPEDGPGSIGNDSGESGGSRVDFDDVDDYDGWYASPPEKKDGTPLTALTGWSREVQVKWVNPIDVVNALASETGAKRVRVIVKHNNVPMSELVTVRTSALPEIDR